MPGGTRSTEGILGLATLASPRGVYPGSRGLMRLKLGRVAGVLGLFLRRARLVLETCRRDDPVAEASFQDRDYYIMVRTRPLEPVLHRRLPGSGRRTCNAPRIRRPGTFSRSGSVTGPFNGARDRNGHRRAQPSRLHAPRAGPGKAYVPARHLSHAAFIRHAVRLDVPLHRGGSDHSRR